MGTTIYNDTLRAAIKELLAKCTPEQQNTFKLMYARDKGRRGVEDAQAMDINDVVDQMEEGKMPHAYDQCERSATKNYPTP